MYKPRFLYSLFLSILITTLTVRTISAFYPSPDYVEEVSANEICLQSSEQNEYLGQIRSIQEAEEEDSQAYDTYVEYTFYFYMPESLFY